MIPMPVGIEQAKQEEKMKKLLVVLLSLGLIAGLSTTVSAATTNMSMSGTYEIFGVYDDNSNLSGDTNAAAYQSRYSRAAFWQRVRLMPVWNIAEGLTFTARIDALEKDWGSTAWKAQPGAASSLRRSMRRAAAKASRQLHPEVQPEP
jgi:hypothetical protein